MVKSRGWLAEPDHKDHISSLPDDLLSDILSRLPAKLAATTTVLSKRWQNIFHNSFDLNFGSSEFLHRHFLYFALFVSTALTLRYQYASPRCAVRHFRLSVFDPHCDEKVLRNCLQAATKNGVQELRLSLILNSPAFILDSMVRRLEHLRVLKVNNYGKPNYVVFRWPDSLPVLEKMSITGFKFSSPKGGIAKCCPRLMKLVLRQCAMLDPCLELHCTRLESLEIHYVGVLRLLDVQSEKLRKLQVKCGGMAYLTTEFVERRVLIMNVPNLERFCWSGFVPDCCFIGKMWLPIRSASFTFLKPLDPRISTVDLLASFLNTETLSMDSSSFQAFRQNLETFRFRFNRLQYENIKHLKLTTDLQPNDFDAICFLLKCSPNLNDLTIVYLASYHFHLNDFSPENNNCLDGRSLCLHRLHRLNVEDFNGDKVSLNFLEFLVRSSQELREVHIEVSKRFWHQRRHVRRFFKNLMSKSLECLVKVD